MIYQKKYPNANFEIYLNNWTDLRNINAAMTADQVTLGFASLVPVLITVLFGYLKVEQVMLSYKLKKNLNNYLNKIKGDKFTNSVGIFDWGDLIKDNLFPYYKSYGFRRLVYDVDKF